MSEHIDTARRGLLGAALLVPVAGCTTTSVTRSVPPSASTTTIPYPDRIKSPLERAATGIGKRTPYVFDKIPPHSDLQDWPERWGCDCSGFVGWCFRIGRWPHELGDAQFYTDVVYADALAPEGRNIFFRRTEHPRAGDVVVFPRYRTVPNDPCSGGAGHIALITAFRTPTSFHTIDCAQSSWNDFQDAIRRRDQTKFTEHIDLLAQVRHDHPHIDPKYVREPIFARFQRPQFEVQVIDVGACHHGG